MTSTAPCNQKSTEKFRGELEGKGLPVSLVGSYNGARTNAVFRCGCGTKFKALPTHILKGHCQCKKCSIAQRAAARNATEGARYPQKLKARWGRRVVLVGKYVDGYTPVKHSCPKHGEFKDKPNLVLGSTRQAGCPTCAKDASSSTVRPNHHTVKSLRALAESTGRKLVRVVERDGATIRKVEVKCSKHGLYTTNPTSLKFAKLNGCKACAVDTSGRYASSTVRVKGKAFQVQGYEAHALKHLVNTYSISDIEKGSICPIPYRWKGLRTYYPDFKIGNCLVEVKSVYTLIADLPRNRAKAKAVKKTGYSFKLMVMTESGKRLSVPRNWIDLTTAQLRAYYQPKGT